MTDQEREYYQRRRDSLLAELDALERLLDTEPRTADIRRWYKTQMCGILETGKHSVR